MRWISADNARGRARNRPGLIAAVCALAALAALAATPAQAATTLVITPFAHTSNPRGVAMDPAGDVYIADATDNDVVKVTPGGSATVIASGLSAPSGVAVDPSTGDVYIADTGNDEVDRLAAARSPWSPAPNGRQPTPGPTASASRRPERAGARQRRRPPHRRRRGRENQPLR